MGGRTVSVACDGAVLSWPGFRGSNDRISLRHECVEVNVALARCRPANASIVRDIYAGPRELRWFTRVVQLNNTPQDSCADGQER